MSNAPRILVVDDELGPREALRMILRDDYDVVTAGNGNRALEYLDSAEFDLVILDIRMPDISGIELLAEVKKKAPETEVVMITAYASVDTATNALRNGALDYLIKPFEISAVKEVVEKFSRGNHPRRSKTAGELQVTNDTLRARSSMPTTTSRNIIWRRCSIVAGSMPRIPCQRPLGRVARYPSYWEG